MKTYPITSRALLRCAEWGTCWIWSGATNGVGYGRISVNNKHEYVHRAVYAETRGEIPPGLVLDHLCRNTLCFNPSHLEPVPQRINVLRAVRNPNTHCRRGHEWTPENTYTVATGARQCRQCSAARQRQRRKRMTEVSK